MPAYDVTLPVHGEVLIAVTADTEDDAMDLALEMFKANDYEIDWLDSDGKNMAIYEYPGA